MGQLYQALRSRGRALCSKCRDLHRLVPRLDALLIEDTSVGDQHERDPSIPATPERTGNRQDPVPGAPPAEPAQKAGMDREVGDLEDPNAVEDDGALPGRMGGGLAGG